MLSGERAIVILMHEHTKLHPSSKFAKINTRIYSNKRDLIWLNIILYLNTRINIFKNHFTDYFYPCRFQGTDKN